MPRRSVDGFDCWMSRPSSRIRPLVGSISRLIMRSVVVFPHPLGPTRTMVWPSGISRSRRSTATVPPGYRFVTLSKVIKTWPSGVPRRRTGDFRWSVPAAPEYIRPPQAKDQRIRPVIKLTVRSLKPAKPGRTADKGQPNRDQPENSDWHRPGSASQGPRPGHPGGWNHGGRRWFWSPGYRDDAQVTRAARMRPG